MATVSRCVLPRRPTTQSFPTTVYLYGKYLTMSSLYFGLVKTLEDVKGFKQNSLAKIIPHSFHFYPVCSNTSRKNALYFCMFSSVSIILGRNSVQ